MLCTVYQYIEFFTFLVGNIDNLPILMAVTAPFDRSLSSEGSCKRCRSPRSVTSAMRTDLPPSMMCCLPSICAFREILLPVSYSC